MKGSSNKLKEKSEAMRKGSEKAVEQPKEEPPKVEEKKNEEVELPRKESK